MEIRLNRLFQDYEAESVSWELRWILIVHQYTLQMYQIRLLLIFRLFSKGVPGLDEMDFPHKEL